MAKSKTNLPEISINEGFLVEKSIEVVNVRSQIADLQTKEQELKKSIAEEAEELRQKDIKEDKVIGMVRVTAEDLPPIRVEFRQSGGALDPDQEALLDKLFAGSRPELFERAEVVTEVLNPQELYDSLKVAGLDPWDYLQLSVRNDSHRHLIKAKAKGVSTQEAILPKPGFLATVNGIIGTLAIEAKVYIKEYLDKTLKSTVVVGSRGKGK